MQIEPILNAASCRDVVQPVHRLKPEGCVECPGILSTYQNLAFLQVLILTPTMAFIGTLHQKRIGFGRLRYVMEFLWRVLLVPMKDSYEAPLRVALT